jgi:predicted RNA-binding Zn-ribbon protein involved in translation (DUF1610 family)
MGKKKPRFFCDGCGTEVAADADRCPRCGKFFASIRCPRCGFSGDKNTFDRGCPACGYSAPASKPAPPAVPEAVGMWVYVAGIAFLVMVLAALLMYIMR